MGTALAPGPAGALRTEESEATDDARDGARINRAVELRRELEALLEELTPEERARYDRLWPVAPEPAGGIAPPALEAEPASEPPPEVPQEPAPRAPETRAAATLPACGSLHVLDSDGDGAVSGADRYWRYLGLWKDDGDQIAEASEVRSLFQYGIRRVSVRLFGYTSKKERDGEIRIEGGVIRFDLPGRRDRATLVIEAGALARGGDLWLEDQTGEPVDGVRALGTGLRWASAEGVRTPVLCR